MRGHRVGQAPSALCDVAFALIKEVVSEGRKRVASAGTASAW